MAVYKTACPRNCYSSCSFKVHVEDNRITRIDPNPENQAVREGVCLKGLAYVEKAHAEDRIVHPLRKSGNTFHPISWEEAYALLADKLTYLKEHYGPKSVLFYTASGMAGMTNGNSLNFWKLFGGCTHTYENLHELVSVNIYTALILIIAGDIIDRVEFFKEIDAETPQNTMNTHLRVGV